MYTSTARELEASRRSPEEEPELAAMGLPAEPDTPPSRRGQRSGWEWVNRGVHDRERLEWSGWKCVEM